MLLNDVTDNLPLIIVLGVIIAICLVGLILLCVLGSKKQKKEIEQTNVVNENADVTTEEKNEEPQKQEEILEVKEGEKQDKAKKDKNAKAETEAKTSNKKSNNGKKKNSEKQESAVVENKEEKKEVEPEEKVAKKSGRGKKTGGDKSEHLKAEKEETKVKNAETKEEVEDMENVEVKTANQKYMVVYDKEKKDWVIKKTGSTRASRRCKTKKEALEVVERLAENQDLNVSVKKKDGKFQKKY